MADTLAPRATADTNAPGSTAVETSGAASNPYEYIFNELAEKLEHYAPGGFCPLEISALLHERYRIVQKLGHGGYSTIWLAQDEQTANKYVAVKVCMADCVQNEGDILTDLHGPSLQNNARAKASICPVLDRFSISSVNGTHPCFVTIPARCSIATAVGDDSPCTFPLKVARSLVTQLVVAVAYVHDMGYVHGGESSSLGAAFTCRRVPLANTVRT